MLMRRDEVYVWAEEVLSPNRVDASDLEILDEQERARLDRLARPQDRALSCRAHAGVRRVLSRLTGVHPGAWVFRRERNGKPEILEPASAAGIRFNVTHTRGLWAVVIAIGRRVGIDAEHLDTDRIERGNGVMELASGVLARAELDTLRACADEDARRGLFLEYWTLKESYLKARGTGLSEPLDRFGFTTPCEPPIRIAFSGHHGEDPMRWQFELVTPTPRHRLALAMTRRPSEESVGVTWMGSGATPVRACAHSR
jgi:4'-phosphopantetheinyl transferase